MAKNCDNCGHCYIEQVIHVCGRNEGRLPLFDGDGNCKGWKKKRITNGDNVRSMTDEELAELLTAVAQKSAKKLCDSLKTVEVDLSNCDFHILYETHLEWLRQECAE